MMLRDLPNDVYFTIGLVTIIGLAAKDAILIIEFAKDLRAQGKPLIEAAIEASYLRFRPILMTGLAFVFGVAPMVIASGASSKSLRSGLVQASPESALRARATCWSSRRSQSCESLTFDGE